MTGAADLIIESASVEETIRFGRSLGESLVGGVTIGLVGPLGAGKTQLVKGIAEGNGLDDPRRVTSPTFTLVHEYPGRLTLYHADVYRLGGAQAFVDLGYEEWCRCDAVVVVEWADRVRDVLEQENFWVEIAPRDDSRRRFTITANGASAEATLDRVRDRRR